MEWQKGEFWITDDKSRADFAFITEALNRTYWARGRSREMIEKAFHHSTGFYLFYRERPIGFARIVGDGATFAWIADVYVHPDFRARGLGKWLMQCVMMHPMADVEQRLLRTKDAHRFYAAFGFRRSTCMTTKRLRRGATGE